MDKRLIILILTGTGFIAVVCLAFLKAWHDSKKLKVALTEIAEKINAVRRGKSLCGQRDGFKFKFYYRGGFDDSRLPGMYIAMA